MDLQTKALKVIEELCLLSGDGGPFPQPTKIGTVYKIVHVALHECNNPHHKWREELEEMYEQMKKDKLL